MTTTRHNFAILITFIGYTILNKPILIHSGYSTISLTIKHSATCRNFIEMSLKIQEIESDHEKNFESALFMASHDIIQDFYSRDPQ
jgi:hypothetical protein